MSPGAGSTAGALSLTSWSVVASVLSGDGWSIVLLLPRCTCSMMTLQPSFHGLVSAETDATASSVILMEGEGGTWHGALSLPGRVPWTQWAWCWGFPHSGTHVAPGPTHHQWVAFLREWYVWGMQAPSEDTGDLFGTLLSLRSQVFVTKTQS